MGKTEKGAIWIDNEKISAYDFYQGVYQTPDACVEMMFAIFTDVPMAEVRELIKTDIVSAKKRMAFEITKFIRNEQDAIDAQNMSENLFNGSQNMDNAPTVTLNASEVAETTPILDLLVQVDFVKSKGEGRRLIDQKGISMNNEVITNAFATISKQELLEGVLFKKGKKNFIKVIAE
jgi:tyrosyl-tRNA synthetase